MTGYESQGREPKFVPCAARTDKFVDCMLDSDLARGDTGADIPASARDITPISLREVGVVQVICNSCGLAATFACVTRPEPAFIE